MKYKDSIRNKLTIAVFIGCLIPYILGGIYLKSYIETVLYKNNVDNTNLILHQVSDLIDKSVISDINEEVNFLASLECIKSADKGISKNLADNDNTIKANIQDKFRVLKASNKINDFIFIGTEKGSYFEYPINLVDQSYDPRLRPWYKSTIDKDIVVISEPYVSAISNEIIISFTRRIINNGKVAGVVGISVNLGDLTNSINGIKFGESGYIVVMSPQNKFIASPKHHEWLLKTPEQIGLSSLMKLENLKENVFEAKLDGIDCIFNSMTESNGLRIVSIIHKDEILQKSRDITNILTGIYIITLILIFLIIYNISKQITRPILEISSAIKRITNFEFEDNLHIKAYTRRKDEIGTVATALVDMNNNYLEFKEQVNNINDEIKNIDIKSKNRFKLELSDNNPFRNIISSINTLLDKNYSYFNELKTRNMEIISKNELLTATEEELKAQLDEINEQQNYINYLAYHDYLTDLPNRRSFIEFISSKLNSKKKCAIVLLDLDNFKTINTIKGHVVGDKVLKVMADRFIKISDKHIFPCRFGGDEFLFFIEYENDKSEIYEYINRISDSFLDKIQVEDVELEVHYSMGITLYPEDSIDVSQLIKYADIAMYSVKNSGKNGYKFFDLSMLDSQLKAANILNILREAIKDDGFKMLYQPQINLHTGQVDSYEALIRLKNYNISPGEFIKVAENNGLIASIGRIVTEKVIMQMHEWVRMGLDIKPVAVNYSASQLHDLGYIDFVRDLLHKYEIDPKFLEIEITEGIFIGNQQQALIFLNQLKEMGIKIAIDDFGTGYSSLNYLITLPVDVVKLDRSINLNFLEINNIKVMDSLIGLVHSLGLTIIAEGIETREQVRRLKRAGCDKVQGYYFSKPLEVEKVSEVHNMVYNNY